jgi:hypothetical protein
MCALSLGSSACDPGSAQRVDVAPQVAPSAPVNVADASRPSATELIDGVEPNPSPKEPTVEPRGCTRAPLSLPDDGSCTFSLTELDAGVVDLDLVNLTLETAREEELIIWVDGPDDCGDQPGWYEPAPNRIALCPSVCELRHADAGAHIEIVFSCYALPSGADR